MPDYPYTERMGDMVSVSVRPSPIHETFKLTKCAQHFVKAISSEREFVKERLKVKARLLVPLSLAGVQDPRDVGDSINRIVSIENELVDMGHYMPIGPFDDRPIDFHKVYGETEMVFVKYEDGTIKYMTKEEANDEVMKSMI